MAETLRIRGRRKRRGENSWPTRQAKKLSMARPSRDRIRTIGREETYENPGFIAAYARGSRHHRGRLRQIVRKLTFDRFTNPLFGRATGHPLSRGPAAFESPDKSFNPFLLALYRCGSSVALGQSESPGILRFCLLFPPEKYGKRMSAFNETFEVDTTRWL